MSLPSPTATAASPAVGAAIQGGSGLLGSLFSGGFNKKAQKRQIKANMQIQQMNNEFNANEALKSRQWSTSEREAQNQWNLDQWNRENEYNSASAQRERLEAAGLNPYMMMNGGSSGTAASIQSSSAPGGSSASSSPYPNQIAPRFDFDFRSISDAINSYFDNKKKMSETVGQDIANQFSPEAYAADIASKINGKYEWLTDSWRNFRTANVEPLAQVSVSRDLQESRAVSAQIELDFAHAAVQRQSESAQKILNKYLDSQQQAELAIKSSQLMNDYMNRKLSKQELRNKIAEQARIQADTVGKNISNEISQSLADSYVSAMVEEYDNNAIYYREMKMYAQNLAKSKGRSDIVENEMRELRSLNQKEDTAVDLRENRLSRSFRRSLDKAIRALSPMK